VIFSAYFFVFVLISLSFLWKWFPFLQEVNTYILGIFKNITHVSNTLLLSCELHFKLDITYLLKIFSIDSHLNHVVRPWHLPPMYFKIKNFKCVDEIFIKTKIYYFSMICFDKFGFFKFHLWDLKIIRNKQSNKCFNGCEHLLKKDIFKDNFVLPPMQDYRKLSTQSFNCQNQPAFILHLRPISRPPNSSMEQVTISMFLLRSFATWHLDNQFFKNRDKYLVNWGLIFFCLVGVKGTRHRVKKGQRFPLKIELKLNISEISGQKTPHAYQNTY